MDLLLLKRFVLLGILVTVGKELGEPRHAKKYGSDESRQREREEFV
jgi:hypothetical protein